MRGDITATFRPADRLSAVGVSEILAIGARASALKAAGRDIIILGAGEPDFDTPAHIVAAAARAMQAGETRDTPLPGTPALKAAISRKFRRENGVDYAASEIIACTGARQIIFNALMATQNPGDEVIIPTPYWVTYADIVRLLGGVPVLVPCPGRAGLQAQPRAAARGHHPRTRWLMLNSPSNPSGAAYGADQMRPLLDVLLDAPDIWLMVDDIHEHIVYDGFRPVTAVALEPRLKDRTLTINGVSRAYAMTGWRLGYAGGPEPLIKAMTVIQSQSTSAPSSISQAATVAALDGPQDFLVERAEVFRTRRDLVVGRLDTVPGLSCRTPEGAFYAFAACDGLIAAITPEGTRIEDDRAF
ncbi:pyridoxal phosphate-dependent aminotransferase [Acidimangrovimonas sediminis]|uniref:pyridoxal phosphate-dependent aminotransferase n=1 Tax=Acidimangrovimonas sediminis TaxID=2056283 RepID=UPI002FCE1A22